MHAAVQIRDLADLVSSLPASFGQLKCPLLSKCTAYENGFRSDLKLNVMTEGEYFLRVKLLHFKMQLKYTK